MAMSLLRQCQFMTKDEGMVRYQTYLMQQLIGTTLIVAFSLTSIVWLMQALRFVDYIVNKGVSVLTFLHLTSLLIPSLITMILPLALLFACLYVYHKSTQDSELVVLFSAGLSRLQVAMPAIKWGGVCVAFLVIMMHLVLPVTFRQFKDLQVFLRDNYASVMLQEDVFNSPVDGLTIFTRKRSDSGVLEGVLVHDSRDASAPMTLMAREAILQQTPQGPRFILVDGARQQMRAGKLSLLYFDRYPVDISLYAQRSADRAKRIEETQTFALLNSIDEHPDDAQKRWAEIHHRITWPFLALGMAMFGTIWLIMGAFNRRGQTKRVSAGAAMGIGLMGLAIGLENAAAKNALAAVVMYLNIGGMIVFALYHMRHEWLTTRPIPTEAV